MKSNQWFSLAAMLVITMATNAYADISTFQTTDAEKLIKAYKYVTGLDEALPVAGSFSECQGSECAFNYETDREDFGINALYVDGLPESESSLISFQVDPNGTSLGRASWTIESPFGKEKLPAPALKAIGKRIKKGFQPLIGDFGRLLVDQSECIYSSDSVWCALNYRTDRENLGIYVKGLLNSDQKSIGYIEVLSVDPNGVWF